MARLSLFTMGCLLLIWILLSLQCKAKNPLDNSRLIRSQEADLRRWCQENCVTEWTPWSICNSRCGQGRMSRNRSFTNRDRCILLGNFRCPHSLRNVAECNSGCPYGGFPGNNACTGCPFTRTGQCCETEIFCPFLQPPTNGKMEGNWPARPNSVVRFSCDTGFNLVGESMAICQTTAAWSNPPPRCQLIRCSKPNTNRNVKILNEKSGYFFGEQINYGCDDGYTLVGQSSRTCQTGVTGQGAWTGYDVRCEAASCGDPGSPAQGFRDGGIFTYGKRVTFHCHRGYEMKGGSKTIECQSNGQWSGKLPTCQACPVDFFMNGNKCTKCPTNSHTVSSASTSIVQCLCDHEKGFTGPPGGPCQEVFCTELVAPHNGGKRNCGNKVGDICYFSCNDGFVVDRGSTKRTCKNTGDWDGTQPFCASCKLNTYKSGERTCSPCPLHSHTQQPGQMKTGCVCDKGYQGPMGGPCYDVDECETNNGKGPCSDTCENYDGGFRCKCSIPGHKIDPQNILTCIVEKQCRNLTRDDAPKNGGLVCHWYFEENSQNCTAKCNPGYERLSRSNAYEVCGPSTGYRWTFQIINETAVMDPCVPAYVPEYRMNADSGYFGAANLTEAQITAAKQQLLNSLIRKGVCSRGNTTICDIKDVGIVFGTRPHRRRQRGADVMDHSVHFAFNVSAIKFEDKPMDCHGKICPLLRLPAEQCDQHCKPTYKRYLRAAVEFAKRQLTDIFQDTNKLRDLSFNVESLRFVPEENGFRASDVFKECPEGMVAINDQCVPCEAGTYLNEDKTDCVKCPHNTYQDKDRQSTCIPCTSLGPGYSTHGIGSTACHMCPKGRWGDNCVNPCNCAGGTCNLFDGSCTRSTARKI